VHAQEKQLLEFEKALEAPEGDSEIDMLGTFSLYVWGEDLTLCSKLTHTLYDKSNSTQIQYGPIKQIQ